jgi:hypothetical protein
MKVFTSTSVNDFWDGTMGESKLPKGVYYYVLNAPGNEGEKYYKKGFLHLIR